MGYSSDSRPVICAADRRGEREKRENRKEDRKEQG